MTVTVNGSLQVLVRTGRNGEFKVGKLKTTIGLFSVKDPLLEELAPGEYAGAFIIEEVYPWSYSTPGYSIMEVRAKLADIMIDSESDSSDPEPDQLPDPADEQPAPPDTTNQGAGSSEPPQPEEPAPITSAPAADLTSIFGRENAEIISAGGPLKLDKTVDRLTLRRQTQYLRESLPYEFSLADQTWYPEGHPQLKEKLSSF